MKFEENAGKTIQVAFLEYHTANPEVYEKFKHLAFRAIQLGKKKLSFKMIMNVIRWEIYLKSQDSNPVELKGERRRFKINDAYGSRYARMFISDYPGYADKVELRELRTA